ncbi:MAG: DUF1553 domain-containing protein [Verrucomicrobia bacterium]|nr:DUF1553 domain-containing protein [Verrucomicrobiota bacterium]
MRFLRYVSFAVVSCAACALGAAPKLDFSRDVRPILSDNCFACHGPDTQKMKGGLRLDSREAALKPAKSGALAIVPGKPEKSALVQRITAKSATDLMPPPESHKTLTIAQKDTLRRWIAEGANYSAHWAFVPPQRPSPPVIGNPIDSLLLARLKKDGLTFSPEADRTTLIRRLSLDLTGIPPSPSEVDAFLADKLPNAYERVVDRLLASPRYGERMAMLWLDYARYADSHGFQTDSSRSMWPWRDWVIKSFNDNVPFDRFTVEQLAGDLLPNPRQDQLVATGFNRNHRINGEGGLIAEEWRIETIIDRVETTGTTWLGLTFNCCRCHDHKYDPITQREFYSFFAFFNSIEESGTLSGTRANRGGGNPEPTIHVKSPEHEAKLAELEKAHATAEARQAEVEKQLPKLIEEWEPTFLTKLDPSAAPWKLLEPTSVRAASKTTFTRQADASWLAVGAAAPQETYTVTAPVAAGQLGGVLLESLPDASLPAQSVGRAPNGNFILSGIEAEISAPSLGKPEVIQFSKAEASYSQKGYEVALVLDGKGGKGWAVDGPTRKEPLKAMFLADRPVSVPAEATLTVRLVQKSSGQHAIGRFRLSATSLPPGLAKLDGGPQVPESLKKILATEPSKRTAAQRAELTKFFRANVESPAKSADAAVAAAKKAVDDYEAKLPTTMVMKEVATPRDAFVLVRGEYDKKGDKVAAGVPAVLPPLPVGAPTNRLGLAQWLVAPENPLTARVWVNRTWEKFFGHGLVKTTENFGSQAEPPSHPELLDWLATEFIRLGWDMKAFQKTLVMSAAYRQSSKVTPELVARDPENRLLAHGPRFRLPAELIRDQALAASGLLVERLGGPSVRPYMPEGVWDETSRYGDLRGYKPDTADGLYRRTLYTIWKRTAAPPTMLLFDSPTREVCTVKRSRTNTPLQALALLNEVTYVEAARALAQRMLTEGGVTAGDRITHGFRRVTGRMPDKADLAVLTAGLEKRLAKYRADADAAKSLLAQGQFKSDAKLDAAELAAYTVTANVLLNLDEAVTRE